MGFSLGHACRFSGAFGVSGQNGIGFSGAFASHSNVLKIALTYQSVILHRGALRCCPTTNKPALTRTYPSNRSLHWPVCNGLFGRRPTPQSEQKQVLHFEIAKRGHDWL